MTQRPTTVQPAQTWEKLAEKLQAGSEIRVPESQAELNALGMLRSELRSQLAAITQLRQELTNQVAQARATNDDASARELQARIRELQNRSAGIERRLLQVDDAISTGIARGITTSEPRVSVTVPPINLPPFEGRPDMVNEDVFFRSLVGMTLLFTFLGVLIHRRAWRRAEKRFGAVSGGGRAELQQLQQAVDVIAVEVERISEGQRYVSKLLSERLESPSLSDGREHVLAAQKDADPPRRSR